MKHLQILLWINFISLSIFAQEDPIVTIAKQELNREFEILSKEEYPAFYMDYRIQDVFRFYVSADFGALEQMDSASFRIGSCQIRVGSYNFDNTYTPKPSDLYRISGVAEVISDFIPRDNKPDPIKLSLWNMSLRAYESASDDYEKLESTDLDTNNETSPSFAKVKPEQYYEVPLNFREDVDIKSIQDNVKRWSSYFEGNEDLEYGMVTISAYYQRNHLVSSEGSSISENQPQAYLFIHAGIKGSDQSIIPLSKSYFAFSVNELPMEEVVKADVEELINLLKELKSAPAASPYSGPALLHPRAAGVFFHEIFGHRIEGHRLGSDSDGQTYKERLNQLVLPQYINVYSDPTLLNLNNNYLNGGYKFDDQGVKATRVTLVEDGILKNFLMSRTPIDTLIESNGHGRAQNGTSPVSRQSNLIIETTSNLNEEGLRHLLIDECKHQGKEYGYYFRDVEGGYTETSRYNTNAFNIQPTLVYRVYVDGRPDELVKGVDLIGTPLSMFAEIGGTSNSYDTFIGFCGAESGSVPVSATAPGLMVRRIETQKKPEAETYKEKFLPKPAFQTSIIKE